MTEETNKQPAANTPPADTLEKALNSYNLRSHIQQVKGEEQWEKTGRGAKTLFKSQTLRIVLNVMQAGTEIKQHHANGPISVQVIEGHLIFETENRSVELRQGELLTLKEYIKHKVEAVQETAFLLTVAPLPEA